MEIQKHQSIKINDISGIPQDDAIKIINKYIDNNWDDHLPITGGNAYAVQQELRMISESDLGFWNLYLFQYDYFTNLYQIEGDEHLMKS